MAASAMLRRSDSQPFFDIVKLGSGRAGLADHGVRRLQQCHRPARLSPARPRLVPQDRTEDEIDQIDLEAPDLIPNCLATILHQSRSELSRPVPANPCGSAFQDWPEARPKRCLLLWIGPQIQAVLRLDLTSRDRTRGCHVTGEILIGSRDLTSPVVRPTNGPFPYAFARMRGNLLAPVAVSADGACYCRTSRQQRCCRRCPHRPRNADVDARPCTAAATEMPLICFGPVRWVPRHSPTSPDRSNSSGLLVLSSSSCGYSSARPWHGSFHSTS